MKAWRKFNSLVEDKQFKINRRQARTFFTNRFATPSRLVLRLIYGPDYENVLNSINEQKPSVIERNAVLKQLVEEKLPDPR